MPIHFQCLNAVTLPTEAVKGCRNCGLPDAQFPCDSEGCNMAEQKLGRVIVTGILYPLYAEAVLLQTDICGKVVGGTLRTQAAYGAEEASCFGQIAGLETRAL